MAAAAREAMAAAAAMAGRGGAGGKGGGNGGGRAAANPAWCGMRRRWRGTGRGRSRCREWRPARAACTHSPSSTMTFILVADLRWKVGARGEVSERGWRRMLRQGNAHRGRAARQLSAPQPGKQTLPTGNHFCARHGGGQSQGLCRAAKAEGVLRPEPMAGASDARPLFAQTAVHRSMPGGCIEQMPNKTCSRGTRGLSDVGSARGACAAAAALRGHARVVQARVRRGVPSGWGALASQEEPPSKFSNGRAKCRFKRRGEGYCSRTPGTNRKAVGLETCRVNPSHTNLLHHLSQKLSLLLVLLVHSVCGGAIHVNKLPRPSSHYYRP